MYLHTEVRADPGQETLTRYTSQETEGVMQP